MGVHGPNKLRQIPNDELTSFFRYSCMVFEIASSELGMRVSFFRLGKLIMRVYLLQRSFYKKYIILVIFERHVPPQKCATSCLDGKTKGKILLHFDKR